MTFVVAQKFGESILIAADTMISDRNAAREDRIPGKLKIIILDPFVTIAFAGCVGIAMQAIRLCKTTLAGGEDANALLKILRRFTAENPDKVEFLVVRHSNTGILQKVWNGLVASDLSIAYIGNPELFDPFVAAYEAALAPIVPTGRDGSAKFSQAFNQLFTGVYAGESVGGVPLVAECLPTGHSYHSGFYIAMWEPLMGGQSYTAEQIARRRNGTTEFAYHISAPLASGIAVLGISIPHAKVGFVYAPLIYDDPIHIIFSDGEINNNQVTYHGTLSSEIERCEMDHQFGLCFVPEPVRTCVLSDEERERISIYASLSPLPATVLFHEETMWVQCGTEDLHHGSSVQYCMINGDPVPFMSVVIDRMNDRVLRGMRAARTAP